MVRKTVSLSPALYALGEENAARRGFANSFSAYVAWLIQRDTEGAVLREEITADATADPPRKPAHFPTKAQARRASGK